MDRSEISHRRSLQLKDYDYSQVGAYFVTICVFRHRKLFGEIHDNEMQLNALGQIASAQWLQLQTRFSNLELGEWVIMPNHIHGILVISDKGEASLEKSPLSPNPLAKDASPLRPSGTTAGSVGAIIQNYKSVTSRKISAQQINLEGPIWQRNYYEHIIRNQRELQAITDYIQTNPQNWEKDSEYQG